MTKNNGKFNLCAVIASIRKFPKPHVHQRTKTSGTEIKILFRKAKLLGLCFIICQRYKFKFYVDLRDFKADLLLNQPSVNYFPKGGDA